MANYFTHLVTSFFISLLISFLLTPFIKYLIQKSEIFDLPGRMKIHRRPMPTAGGLAIYAAFLISLLYMVAMQTDFFIEFSLQIKGFIIASLFIVILGFIDDLINLSPWLKLAGQFTAGLILYFCGFQIQFITNPFGGQIYVSTWLSIFLTVFWTAGLINAINLIDGLDGLAVGITSIGLIALLAISLFLHDIVTVFFIVALLGGCLGFLRYNFYPAKIFMGNTGSMFLGLALASISILGFHKVSTSVTFLVPIVALGFPIFDTIFAVIRRWLKKTSIFKADKKHLHHRLLSMGLNQVQVVLFLYFLSAYLGIMSFLLVFLPHQYALLLLFLITLGTYLMFQGLFFVGKKLYISSHHKPT